MEKILKSFNAISYLGYPLMAIAIYYTYAPLFVKDMDMLDSVSKGLVVLGFGLGIYSFKDMGKINKLDRFSYKRPKLVMAILAFLAFISISSGAVALYLMFYADKPELQNLAMGMLSLCLGSFGHIRNVLQALKDRKEEGWYEKN